ncbi:MAG: ATPase [Candidatus Berkelbacteria bacterium Licking1014_7]|uniref:ATPase n=1 Tax=Candidatus Berkelbacteria bacterium Licking1014_7 TaxID=2017147 RepID=A0A554LIZ8_9BACT|nr:MAG: ATPase [Candidatus Berkelbacteria bacterium Licking1014_7]
MKEFIRKDLFDNLWQALNGWVNLIQVIVGPRQIGKTTLAWQILERWSGEKIYETADQPATPPLEWLKQVWQKARDLSGQKRTLLVLDEVQKIPRWSELVKKLFDEDKRAKKNIRVLILGSSSLLVQKGLSESLAGRFELHRHYQWSLSECRQAFGLTLNEYLFFGGYPGGLTLRSNEERWSNYIRDSLIETVLAKDILLMSPVAKPALLRQTFNLAVSQPAQIISYQKILGTLVDAGNTTTIASYLRLLGQAFLVIGLERYSGAIVKQRGSTPKIIVYDNGLISSMSNLSFRQAMRDSSWRGRLVENAVGARLKIVSENKGGELFYWRRRQSEVDFIIRLGNGFIAIEVKSGASGRAPAALKEFTKHYPESKGLIISAEKMKKEESMEEVSVEDFLMEPMRYLG